MKDETKFRRNQVIPFLKRLKNTCFEPIQQVAIRGSPDFLLCINGAFVGLELKSLGGKISALQKYKKNEIEVAGGVYLLAHPENWGEIKTTLTRMASGLF